MNFKTSFLFLFLWGLMVPFSANAQDYDQLRKVILQQQAQTRQKINSIDALINRYKSELQTTSRKYDEIYEQYKKLERQLALHKKKIASLEKTQQEIQEEIKVINGKVESLQEKLHRLISNYKKAMRYVYEHGRTTRLALLLTSESIHQMLVRNYYLKKFEEYRNQQEADIKKTEKDLTTSRKDREQASQKNEEVLEDIRAEKKVLARKTDQQKRNVALLRNNKAKLSDKLEKGKKQKVTLNQTLAHLISREKDVRAAKKRALALASESNNENETSEASPGANAAGKHVGYVGVSGFLTDAQLQAIQADFAKQKGSLPWPVASTTVSEHFGVQTNPIYGTVTPNLGIEIVTKPDAPVHVVHKGYVFAVQPVTGYGIVVFVSHGKYKTAYGNLSRVTVRKNTILQAGQLVGYGGDESSVRGSSVFFMLRVGNENVDPENWLK